MTSTAQEEALAAIRKANPKWPEKLVKYAYMIMPTDVGYAYAEGTPQRAYVKAYIAHHWTKWAVAINILPDDTPIPEEPRYNADVLVKRVRTGDNTPQGTTRGVGRPEAEYVPNPSLTLVQRNGVWPPKEGSLGQRIWKMCDNYKAQHNKHPVAAQISAAVKNASLDETESLVEFSRWLKYVA